MGLGEVRFGFDERAVVLDGVVGRSARVLAGRRDVIGPGTDLAHRHLVRVEGPAVLIHHGDEVLGIAAERVARLVERRRRLVAVLLGAIDGPRNRRSEARSPAEAHPPDAAMP